MSKISDDLCKICSGTGKRPSLGWMPGAMCPKCNGSGKQIEEIIKPSACIVESTIENDVLESVKRRGRPPKNKGGKGGI